MPARTIQAALLIALALVIAGCEGSDEAPATVNPTTTATVAPTSGLTPTASGATSTTPVATPPATPTATPEVTATTPPTYGPIALEPILGGREFDRPIEAIANAAAGEFWVADQRGDIRAYAGDGTELRVVLDISEQVNRRGSEEGLLSVALDPAFEANHHVWVYFSVSGGVRRTRLARFDVADGVADPASQLSVLEVAQPYSNHNGGSVRFGPDGMLYLSLGDGGSGGDPLGNGQSLATLLGSVLRLDVRDSSAAARYRIPPDNPFVADEDAQSEIWAHGLRNPWRMAFDPTSGALWLADVGQASAEEVDVIERGGNYGWNRFEGFLCYDMNAGCDRRGLTEPLFNYGHEFGTGRCSITGGVVYRANRVMEIANAYLFADFCSGDLWAMDADSRSGPNLIGERLGQIASFATDAEGEVLLLRFGASIARIVSP